MSASAVKLILTPEARQIMLAHCLACLPEEACGLLGGLFTEAGVQVQAVLPITNALHSPVRFRMDPEEQLKAFYYLDEHNLELVTIFHSHPAGPEHPSPTDLAEFAYPGVFTLILFPAQADLPADDPSGWQMRAFEIAGNPAVWTDTSVRVVDLSQPGQS